MRSGGSPFAFFCADLLLLAPSGVFNIISKLIRRRGK